MILSHYYLCRSATMLNYDACLCARLEGRENRYLSLRTVIKTSAEHCQRHYSGTHCVWGRCPPDGPRQPNECHDSTTSRFLQTLELSCDSEAFLTRSGSIPESTGNLHWRMCQAQLDCDIYTYAHLHRPSPRPRPSLVGGGGVGARCDTEIRGMVSGVRGAAARHETDSDADSH
eukprot:3846950-Rhodomonas_salina.2